MPRARLMVVDAADVALPPTIRTLGVRSATTEGQPAVEAFLQLLEEAPQVSGQRVPTDAGDTPPQQLCAERGLDALVTLRSVAVRVDAVETSWATAAADGSSLDEVDGGFVLAATSDDDEEPTAAQTLLESAGFAYARRLTRTVSSHSRPYFVTGDPRLAGAHLAVRAGDWDHSATSWRAVAEDPTASSQARARALHNLALYHEVQGQYWHALKRSELAASADDHRRIHRYRDELRGLWARNRSLRLPPDAGSTP